jgi:hypothetical protein
LEPGKVLLPQFKRKGVFTCEVNKQHPIVLLQVGEDNSRASAKGRNEAVENTYPEDRRAHL